MEEGMFIFFCNTHVCIYIIYVCLKLIKTHASVGFLRKKMKLTHENKLYESFNLNRRFAITNFVKIYKKTNVIFLIRNLRVQIKSFLFYTYIFIVFLRPK